MNRAPKARRLSKLRAQTGVIGGTVEWFKTPVARGAMRGASSALSKVRARKIDNPPTAAAAKPEINYKQVPLARPLFALGWDHGVVIAADRPALPRRYETGAPAPFRDDLNARADHGSPGPLPRPDEVWRSPTVSALAGAI